MHQDKPANIDLVPNDSAGLSVWKRALGECPRRPIDTHFYDTHRLIALEIDQLRLAALAAKRTMKSTGQ